MSIRFRVFRQMLLGLVIAVSLASIIISACLLPFFARTKVFWMIIIIEGSCLIRSLWSGVRKPLLEQNQTVASEIIELSILLPFELILALVTLTLPLIREPAGKILPATLESFIIVNTTINIGYTTCLLLAATLTAPAYDADVWIRDIDSSPSPFPVPIILSFVFPCVSRWRSSSQETNDMTPDVSLPPCLPGYRCSCTAKPTLPMMSHATPSENYPITVPASLSGISTPTAGSRTSLHQSLVRIPDAAERRASIVVEFNV